MDDLVKSHRLEAEEQKFSDRKIKLSIVARIICGWNGVLQAWREEGGFRNQVFGFIAMIATLGIVQPPLTWWVLALFGSLTVLSFELINTALEALSDLLHPDHHPKIGKVKDLACAAVIVSSFGLLIIGIAMIADALTGKI